MPTVSAKSLFPTSWAARAPRDAVVDVANQFSSTITVFKGGDEPEQADGKSVMQMIILAATEGTPLRIEAEGDDSDKALKDWAIYSRRSRGRE